MFPHGATQVWQDPGTGTVRFQSINEQGHIARGDIRATQDDRLVWDWNARTPQGTREFHVQMTLSGANAYQFELTAVSPAGELKRLVSADFARVDEAPARFRVTRNEETRQPDPKSAKGGS